MADYVIRLPRLPVNWQEQPELVSRYWDEAMSAIETSLNKILVLPEIQEAIDNANAAAASANSSANDAAVAANQAKAATAATAKEASIVDSYVSASGNVLTATSDGTVMIASHQRVYANAALNPAVTVSAGTLTGTGVSGDVIRVYYIQPSRAGGSVTYQYTKDPAPPKAQAGDTHSVGVVTIPPTGNNDGDTVSPPGYIRSRKYQSDQP